MNETGRERGSFYALFGLGRAGSTGHLCAIVVNLGVGALMDRYAKWKSSPA